MTEYELRTYIADLEDRVRNLQDALQSAAQTAERALSRLEKWDPIVKAAQLHIEWDSTQTWRQLKQAVEKLLTEPSA